MRIAIVYLSGGGLSGGARNTLKGLVDRLREDRRVEILDVFVPPGATSLPEVRPLSPRTWSPNDRFLGYPNLRRDILRSRPDVVFIPTSAHLRVEAIPVVCMVRNMEALVRPFGQNPLHVGVKNILRAHTARRACRKAARVIAVSGFVQDFLVRRWCLPAGKVGVVYHGVEPAIPMQHRRRPPTLPEGVRRFWFTAGSLIPYRGYEDALRALALRGGEGADEHLVVAGVDVYSGVYRKRMAALAAELGLAERLHWLGYAGREEMAWCFHNATAFLMTSRLEACPNLVLESMSYGGVSVSTTCPPMPELYGDAALYYPSGDTETLAARMDQVVRMDETQRRPIRRFAQNRAETFSWSVSAQATLRQLELAVQDSRKGGQ